MDIQIKQCQEINYKKKNNSSHADGLVGKESAQGIHIRSGTLNEISRLSGIMVREGKVLDVVEKKIPQPQRNPFCSPGCVGTC